MKTIGLLGGMSWESTITYYEILNKTIVEQLGGYLITDKDSVLPVYDTTLIHAREAALKAIND